MQKKEVSRFKWRLIVWSPIVIGAIIFSVFGSTFFIPKEYLRANWFSAIGMLLIGWGIWISHTQDIGK